RRWWWRPFDHRAALAFFLEQLRDQLWLERLLLGEPPVEHEPHDQSAKGAIADPHRVAMLPGLAVGAQLALADGGGGHFCPRYRRRVDTISEIPQPLLALLGRDRTGGDRKMSECGVGQREHGLPPSSRRGGGARAGLAPHSECEAKPLHEALVHPQQARACRTIRKCAQRSSRFHASKYCFHLSSRP